MIQIQPVFILNGDKGRRYTFAPMESGDVRVTRYEGAWKVEVKDHDRAKARRLWKWLLKLGYEKW